ncbi:MAG: response regulator [Sedimenticola sp.]
MSTALVIEDNMDNQMVSTILLESAGHSVLVADTGKDGYRMAVEQRPDFILLDIQLPDMGGTEVLRLLRADEATQEIPVIAVTSYAMAGDRERLLAAGCNGYLEKPIDSDRFISQIENILGVEK